MPVCNCSAVVRDGMRCPQCGSSSFGTKTVSTFEIWNFSKPKKVSQVNSIRTSVLPTVEPHFMEPHSDHVSSAAKRCPEAYEVCEIVVVPSGSEFFFACRERDAQRQGQSLRVNVGSTRIVNQGKLPMENDPAKSRLRRPSVTDAQNEVSRGLEKEGWTEFPRKGRYWYSKTYSRKKPQ
jgi:hypothetical protein